VGCDKALELDTGQAPKAISKADAESCCHTKRNSTQSCQLHAKTRTFLQKAPVVLDVSLTLCKYYEQ
jgi:hypothetical protein